MDAILLQLIQYSILCVFVIISGAFLSICGYLHWIHRKYSHLPGPKRTSFFGGNLAEFRPTSESELPFVVTAKRLQETYGPVFVVFLFHQVFVFCCDPGTIKAILTDDSYPKPNVKQLRDLYGVRFMGRGLVTEYVHSKWKVQRHIFNPAFSRKQLRGLLDHFNISADKLIHLLREDADTGQAIPLTEPLGRTTLDAIAKAGFGMSQELILEDSPFCDAISLSFTGILQQFLEPFGWILPSRMQHRREVRKAVKLLRNTGKELIENCRKSQENGEEQPNNILSNIIKFANQSKEEFDIEVMVDHFLTFFVAGQDTTKQTLSFAIIEILKQPEILKRVKEEVDAIVGDKDFVEYQDVVKMEYTSLVFKETLRLYPPATGTQRKLDHDIISCGYKIPPGCTLQLSHYIMARMEEFFKDPLTFDPERFRRGEDESNYAYFPFSLGSRSCIGRDFALIEARVIIAKLLQHFELKLDPNQSFDVIDQLTLRPKGKCTTYIYTRVK